MSRDFNELRRCHYLRTNSTCSVPKIMFFFDTETTPRPDPYNPARQIHSFRLGCVTAVELIRGQYQHLFTQQINSPHEFHETLDFAMSNRCKNWVFAHSLGFDLTTVGFWNALEEGIYTLADDEWPMRQLVNSSRKGKRPWRGSLVLEDPPVIVECKRRDCKLIFVDTRNYWPASLAKLGATVGLPKLGWNDEARQLQEYDIKGNPGSLLRLPPWKEANHVWHAYCQRDTEIVEAAICMLCSWWKMRSLGNFRPTAPSLAWTAYRHQFMHVRPLIHGHVKALELERDSYYGGEVRSFYIGKVWTEMEEVHRSKPKESIGRIPNQVGPLYHLDVNSLYPYVMSKFEYPYKLIAYHPKATIGSLETLIGKFGVIACVDLDTVGGTYPVRVNDNGQVLSRRELKLLRQSVATQQVRTKFARGIFPTVLAGPELKYALEMHVVTAVHDLAIYEMADLFSEYVRYFMLVKQDCKAAGDTVGYGFAKLLLNSLSGKFGQRKNRWENEYDEPIYKEWGQWYHGTNDDKLPQLYRAIGHYCQKHFRDGEGENSAPAIAAYITSYGRQHMRKLRTISHPQWTLYQDTDSLHVLPEGYRRLELAGKIHPTEPGKLKVLGVHSHAEYFGLKHYSLDGVETVGSLPATRSKETESIYTVATFDRLLSILSKRPLGEIGCMVEQRTVSLSHPDGKCTQDGWVIPFSIGR